MSKLVLIGIGGTGAKLVEAVVHLAGSGNAHDEIYPILIEQDEENGNKTKCIDLINKYISIKSKLEDNKTSFFKSVIKKLEVIKPYNGNGGVFENILEYDGKDDDNNEKKVLNCLYNNHQLSETIDAGFKKRALMGSVFFSTNDFKKRLNDLIDSFNFVDIDKPDFVICGSIFGGTGASGLVETGKRLSGKNRKLKAIVMMPYYLIPNADDEIKDVLVNSDSDKSATRVYFDSYQEKLSETFNELYFLGMTNPKDNISKTSNRGGTQQKNRAHLFELIAALGIIRSIEVEDNKNIEFYKFNNKLEYTKDEKEKY